MPDHYQKLDPRRPRPLTTADHLALLSAPADVPRGPLGHADVRPGIGQVAERLSRPGGLGALGVGAAGDGQAGISSPEVRPSRPAAPQAPDLSGLRMDPADNPHGVDGQRPERDPTRSRLLALMQMAPAAAGAIGLALGSENVGHAGAGAARGVEQFRREDDDRLRHQQQGYDNWLRQMMENNRRIQLQEVQTQFGLDRDEWREDVRDHREQEAAVARQQQAEAEAEQERQAAHAAQTDRMIDAGAFEAALPRLVEQGWDEQEAQQYVQARERAHRIAEQRARRLAAGGGGRDRQPRQAVLSEIGNLDERIANVESQRWAMEERLRGLRARRSGESDAAYRNRMAQQDDQIKQLQRDLDRIHRQHSDLTGERSSLTRGLSNEEFQTIQGRDAPDRSLAGAGLATGQPGQAQQPGAMDQPTQRRLQASVGELGAGVDVDRVLERLQSDLTRGQISQQQYDQILDALLEL